MINEGIYGLEDTIRPEIQGEQVLVRRTLRRSNGDAAIPPGQAVQFHFYVAQFPFSVQINHSGAQITTTERRVPTDRGGGRGVSRRDVTPVVWEASSDAVTTDGIWPRALRDDVLGSDLTGLAVDSTTDTPSIGTVARMRGIDVSVFGDLLNGGVIIEPDDPPDPVIPFEVTLTPPNGLAEMVYNNPRRRQIGQIPPDETARIDPVFLDKGRGLWTVTVRNSNPTARRLTVTVRCNHALAPLQRQLIPLSLLNHLMASVKKKTLPTIAFRDGNLTVATPTHFLGLMGVGTDFPLDNAVASLIDAVPTFTPVAAVIESRSDLVARITQRKAELATIYAAMIAEIPVSTGSAYTNRVKAIKRRERKAFEAIDASIHRLNALPAWRAVYCIVLDGMFADGPISLDFVGAVAHIHNKLPQIALIFDQNMQLSEVISNLAVDLSPGLVKAVAGVGALVALTAVGIGAIFAPLGIAVAVLGGLGIIKLYNTIDDYDVEAEIQRRILDKGATISHYVKGAFERISAFGAVALKCELLPNGAADGKDGLRILYYDPATAIPPRPRRPDDNVVGDMFDTVYVEAGKTRTRPSTAITTRKTGRRRATEHRIKLARETPGPLHEDFVVEQPATLNLLDQHSSIVVLMMENRSFDHMFHDLAATYPGRGYTSVPAGFSNLPPPGFVEPVGVMKNTEIGIGNSLIFRNPMRSSDPSHDFENTLLQMGDGTLENKGSGAMNGFARDFARHSNSPQIVMSYFGMDALPTYRTLINHYPVCDRWFASLPVGTYPNRLSAFQGNVPFLDNIKTDDPAIGYLEDYSIFDLMDSQGISWKLFESDLGTIRLYDRYRLDVRNVRPIEDLDATLRAGRDTGQLPRVMFIEPQFLFGNDDHPPMDVGGGQEFIKQVIGKFIDFGILDRVLFLITYDEHGGFFDHVAPPGTPLGDESWVDKVADLYPQEENPDKKPKSMGVRVPSIAMSKFMSANAKNVVLDHTSILKTILLHNRRQISTAQSVRFGQRVMRGAHFGQLMDLEVPRVIDYAAIAQSMGYRSESSWFSSIVPTIVENRISGLSGGHPAEVLRGIAEPRAKRLVGM